MKILKSIILMAAVAMMAMTTSCGAGDKALDMAVTEINKQLESQKAPGMEKVTLKVDDDYVVYDYVVDESMVDLNAMKQIAGQQKEQIKAQLKANSDQQKFVELVKLADRGIKFAYKGNNGAEGYEIVLEKDEL